MSAVELKRAAVNEREQWSNPTLRGPVAELHLALAEWLDHEADRVYAAAEAGADSKIAPPAKKAARLINAARLARAS